MEIDNMFEFNYCIVNSVDDDFVGQCGYFKIKCNGYSYGKCILRH